MHSYQYSQDVGFAFNSDMSGDVRISVLSSAVETYDDQHVIVSIQGTALLEFVAEYIRRNKISKIEDMTTEQLLFEQN